jgi:hypothetical protein
MPHHLPGSISIACFTEIHTIMFSLENSDTGDMEVHYHVISEVAVIIVCISFVVLD